MKQATLCLLIKDNKILLGMKKKGFGAGLYNGFGGKVVDGETIESAAVRELFEETGIKIEESFLQKSGELNFNFPHKSEWNQTVHVFLVNKWNGKPVESDEMKPEWFEISKLPLDKMWEADKHWMPIVLKGKNVKASFVYNEKNEIIGKYFMKIYLIRHGETTGDVEDRYGGDYDDHLSEKGKVQCAELAKKMKNKGIQIIYYSPRIRAKETVEIINQSIEAKLEQAHDFRERNSYGVLTGLVKSDAKLKYSKEVEKIQKDKLRHSVKNSEPYDSFKKRIVDVFEKITSSKKYSTIAIVTHGGPISCIFREILKLGEFEFLGDCAIIEIEKSGENLRLIKMENAALKMC